MAGGAGGRGLTSPGSREYPARLRALTILANIFLDAEFDEDEGERMASRLEAMGFSPDELETILKQVTGPVFGGNLLSIAGEWVWWSEDKVGRMLASGPWETRQAITVSPFDRPPRFPDGAARMAEMAREDGKLHNDHPEGIEFWEND